MKIKLNADSSSRSHFPMGSLNPTRAMDLSYQKGGGYRGRTKWADSPTTTLPGLGSYGPMVQRTYDLPIHIRPSHLTPEPRGRLLFSR